MMRTLAVAVSLAVLAFAPASAGAEDATQQVWCAANPVQSLRWSASAGRVATVSWESVTAEWFYGRERFVEAPVADVMFMVRPGKWSTYMPRRLEAPPVGEPLTVSFGTVGSGVWETGFTPATRPFTGAYDWEAPFLAGGCRTETVLGYLAVP